MDRERQTGPADALSAEAVEAALQRKLNRQERSCLGRIDALYRRFCLTGHLNIWDLHSLGYPQFHYGAYNVHSIFPVAPRNKEEFWAWLAYYILEIGGQPPEFLRPITNFELIAEQLARIERRKQIERWQHVLQSATPRQPMPVETPVDFRLRLSRGGPWLEWKPQGEDSFKALKLHKFRGLANQFLRGQLAVAPEAMNLWDALARRLEWDYSFDCAYNNDRFMTALSSLLRTPSLQDRILTAEGQPFARMREMLRWKLESKGQDYHLELVLPNGEAARDLMLSFDGQPPLYVTTDKIYPGPPLIDLETADQHVIPAEALETEAGVHFVLSMGVDLPPKLAARVERVALRAAFHCRLVLAELGNKAGENLCVGVVARTPDGGIAEHYNNTGWTAEHRRKPTKDKAGRITFLEREGLALVPDLLRSLGLRWDWQSKSWQCRVGKNFPEKFLSWLGTVPPHITVELDAVLKSLAAAPVSGMVKLDCTETEIDWFDLRVCLDVSDTELTPEEIKLLLDARGKFVRLKNKGWRRLEFDLSEEDDQRLARLGLSVSEFSSEPQRLHALQLADEGARRFLAPERVEQITRRAAEIKTRVTPTVPAEIRAQLRPYQLDGFHFLAYLATNRFGGILADDMGLGKTLQTLTWLMWTRGEARTPKRPSLVVCPKSVMETWRGEAARFARSLKVTLWRGAEPEALNTILENTDLLVLNYAQLRGLGETLARVHWLAAILDEGQYIKNPDSQTAQTARGLKADYRLILSGTPIENRLTDLWSLMAFAMPGVLGSRSQFGRQFNLASDPLARRRLAARVRPFLLRRTKSQVAADLPDRVEEDLVCEIEDDQKKLYRAEFKHAQQILLKVKTSQDLNEFRFHFLTSLLRLRQICCHPALVSEKFQSAESAKLNACLELLEPLMEEGHKVLVFSQFVSMLDILRGAIKERDWPQFYLAGDTENRGQVVDRFQSANGSAIFLISLKAGGFGLNLTAASYVVLFDPWWNPAVENQAIDRTHRIGQVRKVMAYRLLIKDSIEEKIRALQRKKSALAEDILGEENFAQSLSLSDLQFLFSAD